MTDVTIRWCISKQEILDDEEAVWTEALKIGAAPDDRYRVALEVAGIPSDNSATIYMTPDSARRLAIQLIETASQVSIEDRTILTGDEID